VKKICLNLGISFLSLAFFLLCSEAVTRLYLHIKPKHRLNEYEDLIEQQGVKSNNKAAQEKRIFIIGESAARGIPYTMDSSLSGFLSKLLNSAGHLNWKVINTGIPGRHSFYQKEEGRFLIPYKPDVVILYAGNNDTRDFSNVMRDVPFALVDFELTWHSYFYKWLKRNVTKLMHSFNKRTQGNTYMENNNQDDVWHWTDLYLRKKRRYLEDPILGEKRKLVAIKDYEQNLEGLVKFLKKKSIQVYILGLPIVHETDPEIGDYPRKGYEFKRKILFKNKTDEKNWGQLNDNGLKYLEKKHYSQALSYFLQAEKIDNTYPLLYHQLGRSYAGLGSYDKAKEMYIRGKDLQIQSPGGDTYKNEALNRIAKRNQIPLINSQKALEQISPNGIVGKNLFLDHCHPNTLGHKVIASVLMQELCRNGLLSCNKQNPEWTSWFEELSGELNETNIAREYLLTAFYLFNGTAWSKDPDYKEALNYLEMAKTIMPKNEEIYRMMTVSYWKVGQKVKSQESLDQLKKINPFTYQRTLTDFPYLLDTVSNKKSD